MRPREEALPGHALGLRPEAADGSAEGRSTPMPVGESLAKLGASGATLCLFLRRTTVFFPLRRGMPQDLQKSARCPFVNLQL